MTECVPKIRDDFICPHCGADVLAGATFCRSCGASDEAGWGEDRYVDDQFTGGYGDDDEFDYQQFVAREFSIRSGSDRSHRRRFSLLLLVFLSLALVLWTLLEH